MNIHLPVGSISCFSEFGQDMVMKTLITGVAGFIGNELAISLLARGDKVVGVDDLHHCHDVSLAGRRKAIWSGAGMIPIPPPTMHSVASSTSATATWRSRWISSGCWKGDLELEMPMRNGDMMAAYANANALREAVDFNPSTTVEEGLGKFVAWYRSYYG